MLGIKDNILKTEKIGWRKLEWLQNEKLKGFFVKSKDFYIDEIEEEIDSGHFPRSDCFQKAKHHFLS